jgi:urea transporter
MEVLVVDVLRVCKCCRHEGHGNTKGERMKDIERRSGLYEALGWGALFLWLGIASLVRGLPDGVSLFGVGAILLALNLARRLSRIPVNRFTVVLGSMAAVGGSTVLVLREWFGMPPVDLPFFPTLLLGVGVVIVAYTLAHWRRPADSEGAPQ